MVGVGRTASLHQTALSRLSLFSASSIVKEAVKLVEFISRALTGLRLHGLLGPYLHAETCEAVRWWQLPPDTEASGCLHEPMGGYRFWGCFHRKPKERHHVEGATISRRPKTLMSGLHCCDPSPR